MTIYNPPSPYTPPWADLPPGAIAQTFPRGWPASALTLTTGRLSTGRIWLPACTVASITFTSGSTALSGGTHSWAALFTSARALLGQSTDDTSPTWAATAEKTFTLSSPISVQAGYYYVGIMIEASTPPTLAGVQPGVRAGLLDPPVGGLSSTGLTTTAPATAAVWGTSNLPYAYVS